MKFTELILITLALLSMLSEGAYSQEALVGQPSAVKKDKATPLGSMVSTNSSTRDAAAADLDRQRSDLIGKLSSVLGSTNPVGVKVDAVIVLGQYRAAEVAPLLVHDLAWDETDPASRNTFGAPPTIYQSPGRFVSRALSQIGLPAIPELLDTIVETDATNTSAKCVQICCEIEGRNLTRVRLQTLLEYVTDQTKKERVRNALDCLEHLDPRKLGWQGIPELLNLVDQSNDTNMPTLLVTTCVSVEGREMTQARLQTLLDKATDPEKKERIQSAMEILKKMPTQK